MRNIIYIVLLLITASQIVALPIVAMERTVNLTDGSGYTESVVSYDADSKYPVKKTVETYSVNFAGSRTNLIRKREFVGDHIIVKLKDGVSIDQLKKLNHKHHTFIRSKLLAKNTYLVGLNNVMLDSVSNVACSYNMATDIIEYAENDYFITLQDTNPNDPYFASHQWGKKKISCPAAWDIERGTGGVVIAILDTGVDYNHPDLASNIWANPGETGIDSNGVNMATNGIDDDANGFIDDVHGWDFYNNDNDPIDDHGHGTKCAGHAGAVGNNSIGVVGVCWNIRIMALKTFSSSGSGTVSDAINCFNYVAMMQQKNINVRLTSNSWVDNYSASLKDAVEDNRDLGILCVAAAGNNRRDIDSAPLYPACFELDNIISVGGSDTNDIFYVLSLTSGSNWGALNVDLAAPAKNVISTSKGGGYGTGTGTSYATPVVAGTVALIWEKAPHLTYQEVFQAIMDGVDPVISMQGKSVSGGRLNVYRALLHLPYGGVIHIR